MTRFSLVRVTAWAIVVVTVIVAIAAIWALTSQSALDRAVARLHERLGDRIAIEGVRRTGVASFEADRIRVADAGVEVDARKVRVVVSFASLLRLHPVVDAVSIAELRVVAKSVDDEPLTLPASLALPGAFAARRLQVERLQIERPQGPIVLRDIDLSLTYDGSVYALSVRRVDTPWATLEGRGTLGDSSPFALDGVFRAIVPDDRIGRVEIALAGNLPALGIGAAAPLYGRRATVEVAVLPFSRSTLALIGARVNGVDLRAIQAPMPHALLDVEVDARLDRSGGLQGNARIVNREPGFPASDRLPLESIVSAFAGSGRQWTLSELSIDAGRAGRLRGQAKVSPEGIAAELQAHGLDLSGLHAKLRATSLAGPMRIETTGERVTVDARLRQSGIELGIVAAYEAGRVEAKIVDSRFRDRTLVGSGSLRVQPERIQDVVLDLRLGAATASASGSFGAPADRLTWALDLPDASLLDVDAAGSIKARGTLGGAWRDPSGTLDFEAIRLRLGARLDVARASGKAVLAEGWSGRMAVALDAERLRWADTILNAARLVVDGTRARHEATLEVTGADYRLDARLAGSLEIPMAWRGTLRTLQVGGSIPMRLEQPVELAVSKDAVRAGAARLAIGQGRIDLAVLDWSNAIGLSTRGALVAVNLGSLHPVLPVPEALRSLVVGGQWDIAMGETLVGRVSLHREGGDIVVPGASAIPARLGTMTIEAQARGPDVTFQARLESGTFGRVSANGSTRAERRSGQWGIAGDAPVVASIEASMPSFAWTRPVLGDRIAVDGSAEVALRVSGSVAEPVYAGSVQAKGLVARLPEFGVTLRDGVFEAAFDRRQLAVRTLRFASGGGQITGIGSVVLVPEKLAARIDLTADKLKVLARPDRLAVVSGQVSLDWDKRELRARGKLTADQGVVELPREDTPRPSRDVVVLGAKPAAQGDANVHADIALDLGQNFIVRGRGLSTRLGGTLRAQLAPRGSVTITGAVRAVDGTYTAFGQKLDIQRGVLTFVGPLDNPALDILAVRKMPAVEVGVAVGGSALLPQIRLVSTPAMSDADKLAWLTLGHGLDQAGRNETAVLQAAALALLARGGTDSQGTLASRFGLDELSLGTVSGTGERFVSVGKRLASNFYVGFERGITGAVSVIKVTYDLSRRWSVQARAGSENAVDLFYTLGFR